MTNFFLMFTHIEKTAERGTATAERGTARNFSEIYVLIMVREVGILYCILNCVCRVFVIRKENVFATRTRFLFLIPQSEPVLRTRGSRPFLFFNGARGGTRTHTPCGTSS